VGIAVLVAAGTGLAIVAGCGGHAAIAPPGPGGDARFVGAEVCKACHRNQHAAWTTTGHSDALAVLQAIGQGENPVCLSCHTVGFGQPTGYTSEAETPQLANVQCENCHGAGGNHVTNPAQNEMQVRLEAELCGGCHQGFHHPTFEQWETSAHAEALTNLKALPFARDECLICHSAEAILASGEEVVLAVEQKKAENGITCAACHDPHGSNNEANLREPETDVCIHCHTSENALPGSTPHHPQREMLLGLGGFEANGVEAFGPNSEHTTAAHARCVTCHVYQLPNQQPTPENPLNTAHTFLPQIPEACEQCHTPDQAMIYMLEAQTEIQGLLDALAPFFTSGSPQYIDPTTLTPDQKAQYDIAKFNWQLVGAEGSRGVHNRDYARHLLEVSQTILAGL
jgi:predicted CXXCH cytochrome family protein